MTTPREFRQEQRAVAVSMAAALAVTVVVLAVALRGGMPVPFAARVQFALRVELLVVGWLVAAIGNVARLRFFSERDIAGSGAQSGSDRVRVAGAILQNTFEQTGLAIVTHLIVAASFARSDGVIVALAGLFVVGRFCFWWGYGQGAAGRAFGFALTFYPSVAALLASAVAIGGGSSG